MCIAYILCAIINLLPRTCQMSTKKPEILHGAGEYSTVQAVYRGDQIINDETLQHNNLQVSQKMEAGRICNL